MSAIFRWYFFIFANQYAVKTMKEKERRNRRTYKAIELAIMEATKKLVEEKGFSNLTLTGVAQEAGVEPGVFYHRYDDLYALIEEFIKRYDYFFTDIINAVDTVHTDNYTAYMTEMLTLLTKLLYANRSMQQLLIWELSEDNDITRRTADLREKYTHHLVQTLDDYFIENGCKIDFRVLAAVVIGGIYYLILHKERSTFCDIDFSTKRGEKLLINTVSTLVSLVFGHQDQKTEILDVARKMKVKGIGIYTIAECTGLNLSDIERL